MHVFPRNFLVGNDINSIHANPVARDEGLYEEEQVKQGEMYFLM